MSTSEEHALNFLKKHGYSRVRYEPDGNVTPDFLIDENIAVEVRTLNQRFGSKGLEEDSIPLQGKIKNMLSSNFKNDGNQKCWYVGIRFSRHFQPPAKLVRLINEKLTGFQQSPLPLTTQNSICIFKNKEIRISVFPTPRVMKNPFTLAFLSDGDSGGMVISELARNINYCVSEKFQKVLHRRHKYEYWWLLLYGTPLLSIDEDEKPFLEKLIALPTGWNRIIVFHQSMSTIEVSSALKNSDLYKLKATTPQEYFTLLDI